MMTTFAGASVSLRTAWPGKVVAGSHVQISNKSLHHQSGEELRIFLLSIETTIRISEWKSHRDVDLLHRGIATSPKERVMRSIYFARIVEESQQVSHVLTQDSSLENFEKGLDRGVTVRAIYSLGPLTEQEEAMFDVLLGIDAATGSNVVADLLARIFGAGCRAG
ncbi:MAG: hypothetical protein WAT81_03225 [Candidatus Moraniibacteriota bacterium]